MRALVFFGVKVVKTKLEENYSIRMKRVTGA